MKPEPAIVKRYPIVMRRLFNKARPYLIARDDLDHVRISARFARLLLKAENGNEQIVLPAIILHDVGWSAVKPKLLSAAFGVRAGGEKARRLNRIHEIRGAAIAKNILTDIVYPGDQIRLIVSIIKRHDSGIRADCIEEKIVKDADKLWRFSKVGFWKEVVRQSISADELHCFLSERYKGWFFTRTAVEIARNQLMRRGKEIRPDIH